MIYKLAEVFHSIQGEGVYTGTPMMFVRLAGCNVGRYPNVPKPVHALCTTVDGCEFTCDTNYHTTLSLTEHQILADLQERHICLTGGEPLSWNLEPFLSAVSERALVHIETSGTLSLTCPIGASDQVALADTYENVWITCCPKKGFDPRNAAYVDEWKMLVGPTTDLGSLEAFLLAHNPASKPVFLQPVNDIRKVDPSNVARCLQFLKLHPEWKLSVQVHKFLELR